MRFIRGLVANRWNETKTDTYGHSQRLHKVCCSDAKAFEAPLRSDWNVETAPTPGSRFFSMG